MLRNPGLRKSVEQPVLDLNFAASQIGSNAAPDSRIAFSRGSNAYFVDSDGLVKKSPHNLILVSETFVSGASGWAVSGGSLEASTESPDGIDGSTKITWSGVGQLYNVTSGIVAGQTYRFSYYVKLGTKSNNRYAVYDHTNGAFIISSAVTSGVSSSEWTRVNFEITAPSGCTQIRFYPDRADSGSETGTTFITGVQVSQHTTLPVDNPYLKTTGSAVYAARLDHDPATNTPRGLLVEEARTNVAPNSEEFAASTGTTRSASNLFAPDGTNTADEFTISSANESHQILGDSFVGGLITTGTVSTSSFFAKIINGTPNIAVRGFGKGGGGTGTYPVFNLTNGTIIHAGSAWEGASIEAYGNGWFRIAVSVNPSTTTATIIHFIASGDGGTISYTGNGTDKVAIWGLQHEIGTFATSYIKTTGASATRNADVATMGPTTGGTELVTNGTFDAATDWTLSEASTTSITGGKLVFASTTQYGLARQDDNTKLVVGRRYRGSFDVTSYTSGTVKMHYREGAGNTLIAQTDGQTSTGTYTVDFTCSDSTDNTIRIIATGSGTTNTYEVDNVSVRELYPFEQYNPAEGTVVCEFETLSGLTRGPFHLYDGTNNTGLALRVKSDAGTTLDVITRDASNFNNINISSIDLRSLTRAVAAYNSSGHARAGADGAKGTSSTNTISLSVDRLDIGTQNAGGSNIGTMSGHIRRLQYSTRFVSELEAQNLTSD